MNIHPSERTILDSWTDVLSGREGRNMDNRNGLSNAKILCLMSIDTSTVLSGMGKSYGPLDVRELTYDGYLASFGRGLELTDKGRKALREMAAGRKND